MLSILNIADNTPQHPRVEYWWSSKLSDHALFLTRASTSRRINIPDPRLPLIVTIS